MQSTSPWLGQGRGKIMLPRSALLLIGLLFQAVPCFAAEPPLIFGLHPNISARTVIDMYQPLREFLEQTLQRPVQLYTAPDFQTYTERTLQREYDIAVTAPHLAHMAQRAGYVPLFHYAKELTGMVIVGKDSNIHDIEDLRGKTLALPDPLTIISIMGLDYLRTHNIVADRDITLFPARSHNNAAIAVERGQAAAAIIGSVPLKQLPEDLRARLRVIAQTNAVPSQFIIVSKKLPPSLRKRISDALTAFAASDAGKEWLDANGFGGLRPASVEALKQVEPYGKTAEKMLKRAHAEVP